MFATRGISILENAPSAVILLFYLGVASYVTYTWARTRTQSSGGNAFLPVILAFTRYRPTGCFRKSCNMVQFFQFNAFNNINKSFCGKYESYSKINVRLCDVRGGVETLVALPYIFCIKRDILIEVVGNTVKLSFTFL